MDYMLLNVPPPGGSNIPLELLIATIIGFLFGLVGLLIGCNCLPGRAGESRSRLCTALASTGIGVSLMTLLVDFGLISVLRLFVDMP